MAASFNLTAVLQIQAPSNLGAVAQQISRGLSGINATVNIAASPQSVATMARMQQQMRQATSGAGSLAQANTRASASLAQVGAAAARSSAQLQTFAASATGLGRSMAGTTTNLAAGASYFTRLGAAASQATQRFVAFIAGTAAFLGVIRGFREGVVAAVDFQKAMNRVGQVSGESDAALAVISTRINELSTAFGASSSDMSNAALILAQTGLAAKDVAANLETLALAAAAPNFSSMAQTAEGMVAVMRQFKTDADGTKEAIGAMNEVAAKFAVEAGDLVTATRKAGGAFAAAGGDVNQLLAIFTSVRATTRESAEEIATGLRTIFARTQRADVIDELKALQVNLRYTTKEAEAAGNMKLENQFVGPYEAVRRLSEAIKGMPTADPRFSSIIESLGGYRQISRVIPLLQQFGQAEKALGVAQTGSLSLYRSAEKAQESLYLQTLKTKEEFLKLFRTLTESQGFQTFARTALSMVSTFSTLLGYVKPLVPLLLTLATIQVARAAFGFVSNALAGPSAINKMAGAVGGNSVKGFARGGFVPGPAGAGDVVNANLTPDEFVLREPSTRKLRRKYGDGLLHHLNEKGTLPAQFATGGQVERYNDGGSRRSHGGLFQTRTPHVGEVAKMTLASGEINKGVLGLGNLLGGSAMDDQAEYMQRQLAERQQQSLPLLTRLPVAAGKAQGGLMQRFQDGGSAQYNSIFPNAMQLRHHPLLRQYISNQDFINQPMYSGAIDQNQLKMIEELKRLLSSQGGTPQDLTLYRGLSQGAMAEFNQQLGINRPRRAIGKTYNTSGFASTSLSKEVADAFSSRSDYVLKIQVPKGAEGAGINPGEEEVLFNPGQRLQITGVTSDAIEAQLLLNKVAGRKMASGGQAQRFADGGQGVPGNMSADQIVRDYIRSVSQKHNVNLAQYQHEPLDALFNKYPHHIGQSHGLSLPGRLSLSPLVLGQIGNSQEMSFANKHTTLHELGHVIDFAHLGIGPGDDLEEGLSRGLLWRGKDNPLFKLQELQRDATSKYFTQASGAGISLNAEQIKKYDLNRYELTANGLASTLMGTPSLTLPINLKPNKDVVDASKRVVGYGQEYVIPYLNQMFGGYRQGLQFASGGQVHPWSKQAEPGTSSHDKIPALLTPNEFVFNPDAVNRFGAPALHYMNRHGEIPPHLLKNGQKVRGYNKGGLVRRFEDGGQEPDLSEFEKYINENSFPATVKGKTQQKDLLKYLQGIAAKQSALAVAGIDPADVAQDAFIKLMESIKAKMFDPTQAKEGDVSKGFQAYAGTIARQVARDAVRSQEGTRKAIGEEDGQKVYKQRARVQRGLPSSVDESGNRSDVEFAGNSLPADEIVSQQEELARQRYLAEQKLKGASKTELKALVNSLDEQQRRDLRKETGAGSRGQLSAENARAVLGKVLEALPEAVAPAVEIPLDANSAKERMRQRLAASRVGQSQASVPVVTAQQEVPAAPTQQTMASAVATPQSPIILPLTGPMSGIRPTIPPMPPIGTNQSVRPDAARYPLEKPELLNRFKITPPVPVSVPVIRGERQTPLPATVLPQFGGLPTNPAIYGRSYTRQLLPVLPNSIPLPIVPAPMPNQPPINLRSLAQGQGGSTLADLIRKDREFKSGQIPIPTDESSRNPTTVLPPPKKTTVLPPPPKKTTVLPPPKSDFDLELFPEDDIPLDDLPDDTKPKTKAPRKPTTILPPPKRTTILPPPKKTTILPPPKKKTVLPPGGGDDSGSPYDEPRYEFDRRNHLHRMQPLLGGVSPFGVIGQYDSGPAADGEERNQKRSGRDYMYDGYGAVGLSTRATLVKAQYGQLPGEGLSSKQRRQQFEHSLNFNESARPILSGVSENAQSLKGMASQTEEQFNQIARKYMTKGKQTLNQPLKDTLVKRIQLLAGADISAGRYDDANKRLLDLAAMRKLQKQAEIIGTPNEMRRRMAQENLDAGGASRAAELNNQAGRSSQIAAPLRKNAPVMLAELKKQQDILERLKTKAPLVGPVHPSVAQEIADQQGRVDTLRTGYQATNSRASSLESDAARKRAEASSINRKLDPLREDVNLSRRQALAGVANGRDVDETRFNVNETLRRRNRQVGTANVDPLQLKAAALKAIEAGQAGPDVLEHARKHLSPAQYAQVAQAYQKKGGVLTPGQAFSADAAKMAARNASNTAAEANTPAYARVPYDPTDPSRRGYNATSATPTAPGRQVRTAPLAQTGGQRTGLLDLIDKRGQLEAAPIEAAARARNGGQLSTQSLNKIRGQALGNADEEVKAQLVNAEKRALQALNKKLGSTEALRLAEERVAKVLTEEVAKRQAYQQAKDKAIAEGRTPPPPPAHSDAVALDANGQILGLKPTVDDLTAKGIGAPGAGPDGGPGVRRWMKRKFQAASRWEDGIRERLKVDPMMMAIGASMVAPAVGGMLQGDAETAVLAGREYMHVGGSTAAGGLQGAAFGGMAGLYAGTAAGVFGGATAGAATGAVGVPIIGAAVGASIGAFAGGVSSFREAVRELGQIKLDHAVVKLADRLQVLSSLSEQAPLGYEKGALDEFKTISQESATQSFNQSGWVGFDSAKFAALEEKSARQNLGPQLPAMNARIQSEIARFIREYKGGDKKEPLKADSVLATIQENPLNRELIQKMAALKRVPVSSVLEEQKIFFAQRNRQVDVEDANKAAARGEQASIGTFGRLANNAVAASDALRSLRNASNHLAEVFDTTFSAAARADVNPELLGRIGTGNEEVKPLLELIKNNGGEAGEGFYRSVSAVDVVRQELPSILQAVAKGVKAENANAETDFTTQVGTLLRARLGDQAEDPYVRRVIDTVRTQLDQAMGGERRLQGLTSSISDDVTGVTKRSTAPALGPIQEFGQKFLEPMLGIGNEYADKLAQGRKQGEVIGSGRDRTADMEAALVRSMAQVNAEQNFQRGDPFKGLSVSDLAGGFVFSQQRLAKESGAGGDGMSPQSFVERFQALTPRIEKLRDVQTAALTSGNTAKYQEVTKELDGLRGQANLAARGLRGLAESTQLVQAIQEKMRPLQADREGRLGFAERYFSGNMEQRIETQRGLILANQAYNSKTGLDGFTPQDQALIINTFRLLGSSVLKGFKDSPVASDALAQVLSKTAGGIPQLAKDDDASLRQLQKDLIEAQKKQVDAQKASVDIQVAANDSFLAGLKTLFQSFFANLNAKFNQDKLQDLQNKATKADLDRKPLEDIAKARDTLVKAGVNTDERLEIAGAVAAPFTDLSTNQQSISNIRRDYENAIQALRNMSKDERQASFDGLTAKDIQDKIASGDDRSPDSIRRSSLIKPAQFRQNIGGFLARFNLQSQEGAIGGYIAQSQYSSSDLIRRLEQRLVRLNRRDKEGAAADRTWAWAWAEGADDSRVESLVNARDVARAKVKGSVMPADGTVKESQIAAFDELYKSLLKAAESKESSKALLDAMKVMQGSGLSFGGLDKEIKKTTDEFQSLTDQLQQLRGQLTTANPDAGKKAGGLGLGVAEILTGRKPVAPEVPHPPAQPVAPSIVSQPPTQSAPQPTVPIGLQNRFPAWSKEGGTNPGIIGKDASVGPLPHPKSPSEVLAPVNPGMHFSQDGFNGNGLMRGWPKPEDVFVGGSKSAGDLGLGKSAPAQPMVPERLTEASAPIPPLTLSENKRSGGVGGEGKSDPFTISPHGKLPKFMDKYFNAKTNKFKTQREVAREKGRLEHVVDAIHEHALEIDQLATADDVAKAVSAAGDREWSHNEARNMSFSVAIKTQREAVNRWRNGTGPKPIPLNPYDFYTEQHIIPQYDPYEKAPAGKGGVYRASGGSVGSHPGQPKGTDTIPAWLTANEFVINAKSSVANRPLLERINNARGPVHLADGGFADLSNNFNFSGDEWKQMGWGRVDGTMQKLPKSRKPIYDVPEHLPNIPPGHVNLPDADLKLMGWNKIKGIWTPPDWKMDGDRFLPPPATAGNLFGLPKHLRDVQDRAIQQMLDSENKKDEFGKALEMEIINGRKMYFSPEKPSLAKTHTSVQDAATRAFSNAGGRSLSRPNSFPDTVGYTPKHRMEEKLARQRAEVAADLEESRERALRKSAKLEPLAVMPNLKLPEKVPAIWEAPHLQNNLQRAPAEELRRILDLSENEPVSKPRPNAASGIGGVVAQLIGGHLPGQFLSKISSFSEEGFDGNGLMRGWPKPDGGMNPSTGKSAMESLLTGFSQNNIGNSIGGEFKRLASGAIDDELRMRARMDPFGPAGQMVRGMDDTADLGRRNAFQSLSLLRRRQLNSQSGGALAAFGLGRADEQSRIAAMERGLVGRQSAMDAAIHANEPSRIARKAFDIEHNRASWFRHPGFMKEHKSRLPSFGWAFGFADGGLVPQHLSMGGGVDDVPAWLSAGEFVLPKSTVAQYGLPNVQKFAEGGLVGSTGGIQAPAGASSSVGMSQEVVRAIERFGSTVELLKASFSGFENAAAMLKLSFNGFSTAAGELAQALSSFTGKLTVSGTQKVEVVFLGGEVLKSIQGDLSKMVEAMVRTQMLRVFKNTFPDVQVNEG